MRPQIRLNLTRNPERNIAAVTHSPHELAIPDSLDAEHGHGLSGSGDKCFNFGEKLGLCFHGA